MEKSKWQWTILIMGILCLYIGLAILINMNERGCRPEVIGGICCAAGGLFILLGIWKKE